MIPNMGPLTVHAAGKVDGATGALTDGVNVTSVTRTGAGAYTIVLATQIDPTHRIVVLTPTVTDGVLEHVLASDTDANVLVGSDDNNFPGVPADIDFSFAVIRTVRLS